MEFEVKRQCGDCTACCDGRLSLNIFGNKWVGRPCHYLAEGVGCTIYKNRPQSPCKTFECGWLKDKTFKYPEWLKPNKSGFILMDWKRTKTKIPYIIAIANKDEEFKTDAVFWLMNYCDENNINIEFILQGAKYYFGSKEFKKFFER